MTMQALMKLARKNLAKKWKTDGYTVSKSRIMRYRQCQRLHFYAEVLNLERRRKGRPLIRGTIIHQLVEYDLIGKPLQLVWDEVDEKWSKLFEEEKEYYGDLPGDLKRIFKEYQLWYKKDPLKFHIVEKEFKIPFVDGIYLSGVIDAIGKDSRGNWLTETKSRRTLPEERNEYSSVESALYVWAAPKAKIVKDIRGVCWNYIRAKPPTIPETLKNGELSKRKNIDTTWSTYLAEIKRRKLNPKHYKDMKEKLRGKGADFFDRAFLPISKPTLHRVVEEAKLTAQKMRAADNSFVDTGNEIVYVRSIDDMKCNRCDFKMLCQAELMSLDTSMMLKKEYKEREDGTKTVKAQRASGLSSGGKKDKARRRIRTRKQHGNLRKGRHG